MTTGKFGASGHRTQSIWLHDSPEPGLGAAPLLGDVQADVVVVGAGVCGAAAALQLAESGVSVVWLESSVVAGEATGRNAGFILQGTAERYDRAVALMGRDRARAVHTLSLHNHSRMAQVVQQHGISCAYARNGSLQLAGSALEEAELRTSAQWLRDDGFAADTWEHNRLPPSLQAAYSMGVFLPEDGELDPVRFVRGVAREAVSRGVRLFEHTPVVHLDAQAPGDVTAHTPSGRVRAEVAVVCVNAAAGTLLDWYGDRVDPVRGQMLATAPVPGPPVFPIPIYADHGFDYWRQRPDGRVVLGGWRNLDPSAETGFNDVLHDGIQSRMTEFLARFPRMVGVPITHRWSGTMGFSQDGLPQVGPAPSAPGAVAAVGFTGHGFGFAFLAGEALARVVVDGQDPMVELLGPRRLR